MDRKGDVQLYALGGGIQAGSPEGVYRYPRLSRLTRGRGQRQDQGLQPQDDRIHQVGAIDPDVLEVAYVADPGFLPRGHPLPAAPESAAAWDLPAGEHGGGQVFRYDPIHMGALQQPHAGVRLDHFPVRHDGHFLPQLPSGRVHGGHGRAGLRGKFVSASPHREQPIYPALKRVAKRKWFSPTQQRGWISLRNQRSRNGLGNQRQRDNRRSRYLRTSKTLRWTRAEPPSRSQRELVGQEAPRAGITDLPPIPRETGRRQPEPLATGRENDIPNLDYILRLGAHDIIGPDVGTVRLRPRMLHDVLLFLFLLVYTVQ